jgi:hypothetical protein
LLDVTKGDVGVAGDGGGSLQIGVHWLGRHWREGGGDGRWWLVKAWYVGRGDSRDDGVGVDNL